MKFLGVFAVTNFEVTLFIGEFVNEFCQFRPGENPCPYGEYMAECPVLSVGCSERIAKGGGRGSNSVRASYSDVTKLRMALSHWKWLSMAKGLLITGDPAAVGGVKNTNSNWTRVFAVGEPTVRAARKSCKTAFGVLFLHFRRNIKIMGQFPAFVSVHLSRHSTAGLPERGFALGNRKRRFPA